LEDSLNVKVLIFGSGSLVKGVCYTLSASCSLSMEICVAARSTANVAEIVAASNIRAGLMGANISFVGCEVCWEEEAIERLRKLRRPLPAGFRFDRTAANER